MGSLLALTLWGSPRACDRAARCAFDVAASLERGMTRFEPSSDVSRIGARAGAFVAVTPEVAHALRRARALAAATDGAFDPTIGALADTWRRARGGRTPPSASVLAAARAAVDWRRLRVHGREVRLATPGMSLDLGGFAKGWALDRMARRLRRARVAALLNFGESSIVAVGPLPPRAGAILVRDPRGGFAGWFELAAGACSTSSTRRAGAVHRTIDPRSGRAIRGVTQVTVVAPSAAVAEVASTAMLVLGRRAMKALASRLGVEACWIGREGIATTRGFRLRAIDARGAA